ncbi:TPA: HAMP domain-containing histidine kinase [Bacillus thuringiensis]|uniref:sensor histidine kinase n=1 Tax=Bacillus sp. CH_70 TaxID=2978215 RepID=UPI0030FB140B|nr:HAMP domain-containing histidine kinase [Bacillus thuringiensis]
MTVNVLFGILIILLGICSFLVNLYFLSQQQHLRNINEIMDDIRKGNYSRRFKCRCRNRSIIELNNNLNYLMNDFQKKLNRLNNLEREQKDFIVNIAHDLRTPISSILAYTQVLKKTDFSDGDTERYIEVIWKKGNEVVELIESFFELNKLENKLVQLKYEKINMCRLIEEELLSFYQEFSEENIQPDIIIPAEDIFIFGDNLAIRRIISNLISNSLKYGKEGKYFGIELQRKENGVLIRIFDRGPGINESQIPFIFEKLYTCEESRNKSKRGNGLGLTIVKLLVELHNGKIFVLSTPYKETVFSFYLPFES